ncbi:MAG: hypothetical protein D6702_00685 [Planctomycetota bacterium]|nr:MAG: hypothetical protein D6702_00685 [Planctomycetota bacterium]
MKHFLLLAALLLPAATLPAQDDAAAGYRPGAVPVELTKDWAILEGGRFKPLDSFARELLVQVSGRRSSELDGISALELMWGVVLDPDAFLSRPYVRIDNNDLKQQLGLNPSERRFPFTTLAASSELNRIAMAGFQKDEAGDTPTPVERDAMLVWNKLQRLDQLAAGKSLAIVPATEAGQPWLSPAALIGAPEGMPGQEVVAPWEKLKSAFQAADAAAFAEAAGELGPILRRLGGDSYPAASDLALEVRYNEWDLFGKASLLYLVGFLILLTIGRGKERLMYKVGLGVVGLGFLGHGAGIVMRWLIAGRAPVSDMFESLVFMGWGVIAIGIVLEQVYRKGFFGMAAGSLGFIALAAARWLPPTVMDSSIRPLMPVLRNTSWLSIHVMTIMLSYSAFALAMGIGHIVMFKQLFQPGRTNQLRTLSTLLYKTIQVGVLFLGAGIAFGAIWANESWGRYWGWDPKETWSAITFFVYLAVIHARYAGWIHNFGLAASSIASFMAVLFTYYGVNYVLGAGLHAYGRGTGGQIYVFSYLGAELLLVLAALWRYNLAVKTGRITPAVD